MNRSTVLQAIYGLLAIAGVVVPWYFNLQFMSGPTGGGVLEFIAAGNANAAASSLSNDLAIAFATFCVWLRGEAKRVGVRFWGFFVVYGICVAFASSFPLFLLMRERRLAQAS